MRQKRGANRAAAILVGLGGLVYGSTPVYAADAANDATDAGDLQEIQVIGSRIKQGAADVVSPVVEISSKEIQLRGVTSAEQLLNSYPQVFSDETPFGGFSGIASVDLRGLGSSRTLVLIDGRRLMPGDPTVPVADINTVPVGLIDSVEVLTGGASATYGSDALAGVVNFKLKRDFEGFRVDAQYGLNEHHNGSSDAAQALQTAGFAQPASTVETGRNRTVTAQFGMNGDDGHSNVTAYASYREQGGVLENNYDFSSCALSGSSAPHKCLGSSNYDEVVVLNTPPAGTNPTSDFFANPNHILTPYNSATDTYNYSPLNYLERPDTRLQMGTFFHKEINSHVDLYGEAMFTQDRTTQEQAPAALFLGTGPDNGGFLVSCNNPFLSASQVQQLCTNFGLGANDQVNVLIGRRNIEGGPRIYDLTHTGQRYVGGVKGGFGDDWTYDVYAQYGTTSFMQRELNELSKSRTLNALDDVVVDGQVECRVAYTGQDPNCVPLDLLGGLGSWTPAMLKYIGTDAGETGTTVEQVYSASATGPLGRFGIKSPWANKPVSIAIGAEYRHEGLEYLPDSEDLTGDVFGGATLYTEPMNGFHVREEYVELGAPVLDDVFLAKSLRLEAGIRNSDYSTSGRVTSSKLALNWAPIEDLHIRASLQHAVRAPNVLELFAPQLVTSFSGSDPCAGTSPTASLATCEHMGVTATEYGHIVQCPTNYCGSLEGGNPDLTPEKSITQSFGFVFSPASLADFSASIDWYHISVSNAISTIGAGVILNQCTQTLNPFFCDLIHRDSTGSLFVNNAGVVDTNVNTGTLMTRGVDLQTNYRVGISSYGHLAFNLTGTFLQSLETEPVPGLGSYDCAGLYGYTCQAPKPKWRHNLRGTWESPWNFDLSANWRYFSQVGFDGNVSNNAYLSQGTSVAPIKAQTFIDLTATARVGHGITLTLGVTNLMDKDPPIVDSTYTNVAANTYPQMYDALGRTMFMNFSWQL